MIRKWLFRTTTTITHEKEVEQLTNNLSIVQCNSYRNVTRYWLGLPAKRRKILIGTERKVKYNETIQEA